MARPDDLIASAIQSLKSNIDFQISYNLSDKGADRRCDAVIEINDVKLCAEVKTTVRNSNQGFVLYQLHKLAEENRYPMILIADYISNEAKEKFRLEGINYLDVSGNACIMEDRLVVYIEGQKVNRKEKVNQTRAFQEAGLKILFLLLSDTKYVNSTYREIADKVDVSLGSVSNVMKELEVLNYLLVTSNKRKLKNKDELLMRWVMEYNVALKPKLLRKKMRFINDDAMRNWSKVDTEGILWGGEPGAAIATSKIRPENFVIFTDLELSVLAKRLMLVPDVNGEVEVLQKFWKESDSRENVAPSLLIYADLVNSGYGRNIEVAKEIFDGI